MSRPPVDRRGCNEIEPLETRDGELVLLASLKSDGAKDIASLLLICSHTACNLWQRCNAFLRLTAASTDEERRVCSCCFQISDAFSIFSILISDISAVIVPNIQNIPKRVKSSSFPSNWLLAAGKCSILHEGCRHGRRRC